MTGHLIHAVIIGAAFAVTAATPREGAAVLLVPLPGQTSDKALAEALQSGAQIAGSGPEGTVVLRAGPALSSWNALRSGTLTIAVPEALCSNLGVGNG